MTARLTSAQRDAYWNDGILFPLPALAADETARYRAAADRLEVMLGGRPRTIELRQMHLHFPWAYSLATHPYILDTVEDLFGPNLLVWATELFAKHPHDANISIGWHRDRKYSGFTSQTSVTAWVALSPSTVENGCMRAVPGPGRRDEEPNTAGAINVVLGPGEMSLHNADILHGSDANRSSEKRVGFAIRYVTPAALLLDAGGGGAIGSASEPPTLLLARGVAGDRVQLAPPPDDIDEQESLGEMKKSAARHLEQILQNLKQPAGAAD
jgi:hypothetical protein